MVIEIPQEKTSFFQKVRDLFMRGEGFSFDEMYNLIKNDHRFYFQKNELFACWKRHPIHFY